MGVREVDEGKERKLVICMWMKRRCVNTGKNRDGLGMLINTGSEGRKE